jgi:hypothetical protein
MNMKRQFILKYKRLLLLLGMLFIFVYSGCEQNPYVVDPYGANIQIYLLSYSAESVKTIFPLFDSIKYLKDSSFALFYEKYEDIVNKNTDTTEVFSSDLTHRISKDTFLDYGSVKISVNDRSVSLISLSNKARTNVSYTYNDRVKNNSYEAVPFHLGGIFTLSSSNSTIIKDFSYPFATGIPNEITNIKSGQNISSSEDLELKFAYYLPKGSIISIGYGQHFIHIEPLQSCNSLTILKSDLQKVLENLVTEKVEECQIGFVEGARIEVLTSTDKKTSKQYQLPIFQFARSYKTIYLKN